jgi:hypothetical protein
VGLLSVLVDRLVNDRERSPVPGPAVDPAATDTVFKYKLLTALMTAGPIKAIAVTVKRNDDGGLTVDRCGSGVQTGRYLSFVASGGEDCNTFTQRALEFKLCNDEIPADVLDDEDVDIRAALGSFVLRDGPADGGGVIVAVAADLPAKTQI